MDNFIRKIIAGFPSKIQNFYIRHTQIILYLITGGLTFLISLSTQYAMIFFAHTPTFINTIVSWTCSVTFAFFMSKFQVFDNKSLNRNILIKQILTFFSSRFIVLLLEIGFMTLTVNYLKLDEYLMKLLAQIFITILNYLASKIIFKKGSG